MEENYTYMEQEFVDLLKDYPPLLNVNHIGEILEIGESKSYQLLNSGKLQTTKIGKQIRVPKFSLAKYLSGITN